MYSFCISFCSKKLKNAKQKTNKKLQTKCLIKKPPKFFGIPKKKNGLGHTQIKKRQIYNSEIEKNHFLGRKKN